MNNGGREAMSGMPVVKSGPTPSTPWEPLSQLNPPLELVEDFFTSTIRTYSLVSYEILDVIARLYEDLGVPGVPQPLQRRQHARRGSSASPEDFPYEQIIGFPK